MAKPGAQSPRHGRTPSQRPRYSEDGEGFAGSRRLRNTIDPVTDDRAAHGRDLSTRPMAGMNESMMTLEVTRFKGHSQGTREELERSYPAGRQAVDEDQPPLS